ncbi:DUF2971 domain-containing protein [Shewanella goraebulensis]|uniref:DUF2971 domain-containing protein n=1 Tax=Shewanella goraebulensis TaxID=3050637 RepID=UPI002549C5A4|nr:DUF2971 domain-containing protein [Shewanella goraebulensis]
MGSNRSLFKFRAFNKGSIELLVNRELWFAKPESLNDPFECPFDAEHIFDGIDKLPQLSDTEIKRQKKLALNVFNSLGVCSFSRARKNQLMWAHYADEHKGFCIGFNESNLLNNEPVIKAIDVIYQADLPQPNVIGHFRQEDNGLVGTIDSNSLHEIIRTKYTYWTYERETRLVMPTSGVSTFQPQDVRSVAFGLRMPERDRQTLITLLTGSEWKHIKWYEAVKVHGRFALEFKEIKI